MSKFESLYKKIELFEKLAVYGNRSSFLKAIAQNPNASYQPFMGSDSQGDHPEAAPDSSTQTTKEMTIVGNPPIPTDVQEMLSRIVTMDRIGIPLHKIDGLIGPETRGALKEFKNKYAPGVNSDAQLFNAIRAQYNKNPDFYGKIDHVSSAPAPAAKPQKQPEPYNPYKATARQDAGEERPVPGPKA
jgi:hypothetical protein